MSWNNWPPAVSVIGAQPVLVPRPIYFCMVENRAQPSTCIVHYEPQNLILVENIIGVYRGTAADITTLRFYSDWGWCVQMNIANIY